MSTIFKRFLLAVCFVFMGVAASFSATYWLPDYEGFSSLGKPHPGPLPDPNPNPDKKTCKDYGMYARGEMPAKTVCSQRNPGNGLTCFTDCKCPAEYAYDSNTGSNLVCSDSCTDGSGKTKYKCATCCPDGYKADSGIHPEVVGWSLCGNLKVETALINDEIWSSCRRDKGIIACYRCVDVCGSGKKYCSNIDGCIDVVTGSCCSDADCRYSTGHCDMDTHICKSVCEDGYSEEKPTCPNGKTLCQQEGNTSCWGCCGTECNSGYSTATTAETCKDGQTFETQADNEACGICRGVACESGYQTNVHAYPGPMSKNINNGVISNINISIPSSSDSDTGNPPLAGNAVSKDDLGAREDMACVKIKICARGQRVQTQSTNSSCAKCVGTACDTANGYTWFPTCSDGQTTTAQTTNSSCKKCVGTACGDGYSTASKTVNNGYKLETQTSNSQCTKLVECKATCSNTQIKQPNSSATNKCEVCLDCASGYYSNITSCPTGQKLERQQAYSQYYNCVKCVSQTCEEQGLKTCNGKCIAADGCCASSECGTGYTCTNNTCTEIPCETGYSKNEIYCLKGQTEVQQATNPNCKKCEGTASFSGAEVSTCSCPGTQYCCSETVTYNCGSGPTLATYKSCVINGSAPQKACSYVGEKITATVQACCSQPCSKYK